MKDFFTESIKSIRDLPLTFRVLVVILLAAIFSVFRLSERANWSQVARSVESILRSEYRTANSYSFSKALSDLESLKVLKCIVLTERDEISRVFYDTSNDPNCWRQTFLRQWFEMKSQFVAVNGLVYDITFQRTLSWPNVTLELISYFLVILSMASYAKRGRRQKLTADLHMRVLALEREMIVNTARQVQHDVASPLSALKIIIQALQRVDPEIKGVLTRAITRMEDIFGDLSRATANQNSHAARVSLADCIREIAGEKRMEWGQKCSLVVEILTEESFYGDAKEFKRILSNLLNNSFEACSDAVTPEIHVAASSMGSQLLIVVSDNGPGMSETVLHQLGKKGFSFGKPRSVSSGKGLGVYHALTTLQSWGGRLDYKSNLGRGTQATLTLRRLI